jgi:hypothetical protein
MDQTYIIEPVEFAFTNRLFKGGLEDINQKVLVINNVEDAFKYAFEQNLPSGYKVWNDLIEQYRNFLRRNKKFEEADEFVTSKLETLQTKTYPLLLNSERGR